MLTPKEKYDFEKILQQKERTRSVVSRILEDIQQNNKEIFKKAPESRLKKTDSILSRMKEKKCGIANLNNEIYDIAGARITCCTIDEIKTAEELIRKHHQIKKCEVVRNFFDEGADELGYVGHHLLVTVDVSFENKTIADTCEVQVRTLSQDLWAILSHRDFYKNKTSIPDIVKEDMKTLSELLQVADKFALTIKKRIRSEIDKEILIGEKRPQKNLLTPSNIQTYIKEKIGKKIRLDDAYTLIGFALTANIRSFALFKKVIDSKKFISIIDKEHSLIGISCDPLDRILYSLVLHGDGIKNGRMLIKENAIEDRNTNYRETSKGVWSSKADLKKQKKVQLQKKQTKGF